jgi:hypothetical protein
MEKHDFAFFGDKACFTVTHGNTRAIELDNELVIPTVSRPFLHTIYNICDFSHCSTN